MARASYLPGASPGTAKYPFESLTVLRVRPVSRFLTTTSTPGRTPPVSSLTVPEMVADVIFATATDVVVPRRTTARMTLNLMTTSLQATEQTRTILRLSAEINDQVGRQIPLYRAA